MRRISLFILLFTCAFAFAQQGMPAPTVEAMAVSEKQAFQSRRYTGLLVSPSSVSLVARISGEMMSQGFEEGDIVKEGQLLYQLDDVRYSALMRVAEANIARCKANVRYSESNYNRINSLFKKEAATEDAMEAALMKFESDKADLASARASLITAKDDLKNTKILAPIAGKIGLTKYTVGNYLTPSSGVLATIVQLDPIRVTFSISNRDFLELFGTEKAFRENASISIRLADGTLYDQKGTFEFMNNEANRTTDTLAFYVSFPNADSKLVPGSSVTVHLHKNLSEKYIAVLPSAIMADNASPYVWVLADDNTAHRRNVVLGPSDGEIQLVASGLTAGEMVIIEGTHKVMMDGMAVKPLIRQ